MKAHVLFPVAAIALEVLVSGCRRSPDPMLDGASAGASEPEPQTLGCPDGWRGVGGDACVALPERFADPPSVVIFAHGIIAAGAQPTADEATLLKGAREHGFAVLFPRGKAGLCEWDPSVASSVCWPTRPDTVHREGAGIVAKWSDAETHAASLADVKFARRYLLGFSNGGYFATYVLMGGLMKVDGAAVVGAGRTPIDAAEIVASPVPLYIGVGGEEATSTKQDATTLAHTLEARNWQVTYKVHPEHGHELTADDLSSAWAAWGR